MKTDIKNMVNSKIHATNYQNQKFKNDKTMIKSLSKIEKIKKNIDLIKELNKKTEKTDRKEINFLKYAVIPSKRIKSELVVYDKLTEQKILKTGFENPILIKSRNNEIEFVGLSQKELSIGKAHDLLIPAIVIDEDNLFDNSYNISSITELKKFIKDKTDLLFIENYIQDKKITINTTVKSEISPNETQTQKIKRIEVENYYANNSKSKLKYATKHNMS